MVKVCTDKFPAGTQGTQSPGYYLDIRMKEQLDVLKKAVHDDWDGLVIIDGPEGSGKSVLSQQMAYYCDPTLTSDRVVFKPDDFKKAVLEADKCKAIVFDEAYGGLSSRKAMSTVNHSLISMLTEIRQKNLFLFMVLPSFFDLDKYAALFRSRALVHVYANNFNRGFFKFYNYVKKKDLYVKGKKFYSYRYVSSDFSGRFTKFYPIGEEEYKKKKLESLSDYKKLLEPPKTEQVIRKEERKKIAIWLWTQVKTISLNPEEFSKLKKVEYYKNAKIKINKTMIAKLIGVKADVITEYLRGIPSPLSIPSPPSLN